MSTPTLEELIAQKEQLERLIAETAKNRRQQGIMEVKSVMEKYRLTLADLVKELGSARGHSAGSTATPGMKKVSVKYKDAETGNQWTGRGLQPKWLRERVAAGAKLEDFLVK